jgi:RimJ/RimL family protein N-acetyltransferase
VRTVFELRDPLGALTIEPLDLDAHADMLHTWITHPRSVFWQMPNATPAAVREEYARINADPRHHAWLGRLNSEPLFLVETYDPAESELATHYPVAHGDVGMHVLVAPPTQPRHGVTSAVMRAVMEFLFADPRHERVVVEPDVGNEAIQAKNAEVGFVIDRDIQLATKTARLSFCTRSHYSGR